MNKLSDRKPDHKTLAIVKTFNNRIIPCWYEDDKFYKIAVTKERVDKYCIVESVTEWDYEIQIPEPVITDDIFLELFCQKETSIQDNVVYSKFIDAWNNLNIDDRILLVSSITKMLKERQI